MPPDNIWQYIGKRLRRMRQERGLSLEQVGQVIGVTRMSMSRYESGKSRMDLEQVIQFCYFYGIDIADLMPPTKKKTNPNEERLRATK